MKIIQVDKEKILPFRDRLEKEIRRINNKKKHEKKCDHRTNKTYKRGICPKCNKDSKFKVEELYSTCFLCDKTFFTSRLKEKNK